MNLKPTHTIVKDYYSELKEYQELGITHEGAVSAAFQKDTRILRTPEELETRHST